VIGVELAAVVVLGLPLLAAVANGLNALTGERLYGHATVTRIAVVSTFAAFAGSLYIAVAMLLRPGPHEITIYRFIASGDFSVDFGLLLDPLSVVMMLVVTGISALVAHFSVNYLHNEDGFSRYFVVVSLFVFAMLVLVMADSYLVMFLGWEGVGVCSYLLISFYRDRPASAAAGTKAFIMNRAGDADLLVAMFLLVAYTGTLQYSEVFPQVASLPRGIVEGIGFLFVLGAAGKSAQLPLGTWLARAMEGPTPSSALMHAATMVTAGVYLVVRSAPIYDQAPTALIAVGIVGTITALYGQLTGYVQTDIKGVLASSTTAQLGMMFLFCGLGLYAVAIFHLVAHAFYKSYLFLTAPSILHHLHGGADPTAVGRPVDTARLLSAAVLALAAGLLAVQLIGRAFDADVLLGNVWTVLSLGVIAAFAAVLSTRRMTAVAFAGHTDAGDQAAGERPAVGHHDAGADPHQADVRSDDGEARSRTARLIGPLCVLAGLIAAGVAVDILPGGLPGSWFQRLLDEVTGGNAGIPLGNPLLVTAFTVAIALLLLSGWYGPRYLDRFRAELPPEAYPVVARRLYWASLNRGYIDDAYDRTIVAPTTALGRTLERFDLAVLDRPPPAAAPATQSRVLEPGVTQPGVSHPTWEARFLALRAADSHGRTVLAEPPERLDWLPSATGATVHLEAQRPRAVGRVGAAFPGLAERIEQSAFQRVDTGALKVATVIAAITDTVEAAIFQTGVERGLARAGSRAQRVLLDMERRLSQPLVIGSVLALALLALIVGTR
jgi:NADH-quinone oxidoreductase subunit L